MKKLGQHFLINKGKIKKFINALDLKPNETIIEIGPGHGELMLELRIKNAELRIIAIEKDKRLAEDLRCKIYDLRLGKNVEIIEGDALKILPKLTQNLLLITHNYKLVGNIPYYITGRLLRIISELKNKPSLIVLTVQKEVAQRIIAQPPKMNPPHRRAMWGMNLLAASVQFWAEPEIIDYVSKKDFKPIPKVDGAILKLRIKKHESGMVNNYYRFIKILFKQPRKTILNNLISSIRHQASSVGKEKIIKKLEELNINPQVRPQDLSLEQIINLSQTLPI